MAGRERLGARRKALGLTQESLAERLRVERSTVARWEQGTSTPRPWYRRRLAEALDLTPDELARMLCPLPESRAPAIDPGLASVPADARRLVELDTRYGGDDLLPLAVRATRAADERLTVGHRSAGDDVGLHSAVAEFAQVAAWIAFDADEQRLSRRFTHEALVHSRLAGDRRVELLAEPGSGLDLVGRPGGAQLAPGDDAAQPRRPGRRPRPVPYGLRAAGPGGEAVPVQRPGPPSRRAGVGRCLAGRGRLARPVDGRDGRDQVRADRCAPAAGGPADRGPPAPGTLGGHRYRRAPHSTAGPGALTAGGPGRRPRHGGRSRWRQRLW
jgi:transcriptional regulator with XRE-family HTH domain